MELRHDPENHRYLADIDGETVGMAVYHLRNDRHIFVHTEVDPGHKGGGVASALARFALDDVKSNGGTVVPVCPFIASWIKRHPEYNVLVDQELLDRINGVRSGS
jgi:hypothetical protein